MPSFTPSAALGVEATPSLSDFATQYYSMEGIHGGGLKYDAWGAFFPSQFAFNMTFSHFSDLNTPAAAAAASFKKLNAANHVSALTFAHAHHATAAQLPPTPARRRHRTTFTQVGAMGEFVRL